MDMIQIAQALGIEGYPPCFEALLEQALKDNAPACDMGLIAQAQEKYGAFGEHYDLVCQGAKEINADAIYSAWVKVVSAYLANKMGPVADIPVVSMNGTPKRDMLMLACQIPAIPIAAEKYRGYGFSEEQISSYLRSYEQCMNSTRIRTDLLGLDSTYFRWLTHFARAEIFRVRGIQFEFSSMPRDLVFLKNKDTGEIIPLIAGSMVHASGKMLLGAGGYTDEEGAYEAVLYEDAQKFVGYSVRELVISKEPETFQKADWVCILRKGEKCLSMHLPRGADITYDNVNAAYAEACAIVAKGRPEYKDAPVYCSSWLLDPGLEKHLGPDSNIVRFGKRFVRCPTKSLGRAADSFVFPGRRGGDEDLPENTSLQRALKQSYLNGGYTYGFSGILVL